MLNCRVECYNWNCFRRHYNTVFCTVRELLQRHSREEAFYTEQLAYVAQLVAMSCTGSTFDSQPWNSCILPPQRCTELCATNRLMIRRVTRSSAVAERAPCIRVRVWGPDQTRTRIRTVQDCYPDSAPAPVGRLDWPPLGKKFGLRPAVKSGTHASTADILTNVKFGPDWRAMHHWECVAPYVVVDISLLRGRFWARSTV